jgi:DNA-binding CsgD family transcriptional regulator
VLFGRAVEIELIESFVTGHAEFGQVLVLAGDAGAGKSALLDAGAEIAARAGRRVLRAAALKYEAELEFGGLNQLLHPLVGHIDGLREEHRRALNVVLGLASGALPSQLVAGAATLALLTEAAAEEAGGLLLVVDDVQWLDLSSSMAMIYAIRRLAGADIRMLVASRSEEAGDAFVRSGFRVLEVAALSAESSDELLLAAFPALPVNARRRLCADAQGNPLALLELPTVLETAGSAPSVTGVLPLTSRLQSVFAERLRLLPAETRQTLLLVVLAGAGGGTAAVAIEEVVPTDEGRRALAPAERVRILQRNARTGRLEFRHPLIRSAAFELSTSEDRRAAHRLLADAAASSPQHRAWHLGQAAAEPDEEVAGLLEAVSLRMLQEGRADGVRAAMAMLRAAELSPVAEDRARRTARAAYLGSSITGDLTEMRRLLRNAPDIASPSQSLAVALATSYQLLNAEGDAATASRLLLAALDQFGDVHDQESDVVGALYLLIFMGYYSGRPELWAEVDDVLERMRDRQPEIMRLVLAGLRLPLPLDPRLLDRLDEKINGLRWSADSAAVIRIAVAGLYLDRVEGIVEPLRQVAGESRDSGATTTTIEALFLLALHDFGIGRWGELVEATTEGSRLSVDAGLWMTGCLGRFARGLVAAARGESALVDECAEQLLMWAAPRKLQTVATYASHLHCLAALGECAFDDAYRHAVMINPPGSFPAHNPHARWLVLDLAEAAARSGRAADALAHAEAAQAVGLARISPRQAMVCTAALALGTAEPHVAGKLFEQALAVPGAERWQFDRARVELLYGEHLRRELAPGAAKGHLAAALQAFERLAAAPWIERARLELRALGGAGGGLVAHEGPVALTERERAVAELAAQGLTNKQIGERLILSPRTVSTHLHRVFHKLDIASRAALRDALRQMTDYPERHDQ